MADLIVYLMGTKTNNYDLLIQKLDRFTRKYYLNRLIRGLLYTVGLLLAAFLLINVAEHFFYFSTTVRKVLFWGFISMAAVVFAWMVLLPLLNYFRLGRVISHQKAANIIGDHFGNVKDRLLNILQLREQANSVRNIELIEASIDQKIDGIKLVPFRSAIDLSQNKKYLKYALIPLFAFFAVLWGAPSLISDSTERLINNDTEYARAAPFAFKVVNENELQVVQFEDFDLDVLVEGDILPDDVSVNFNNFPRKLKKKSNAQFSYKFKKLQKDLEFELQSGGVVSKKYKITVIPKPVITSFSASLDYPAYVGKKDEILNNTGDMVLPVGTKVNWNFEAENTDVVKMRFHKGEGPIETTRKDEQLFSHSTRVMTEDRYTVYVSSKALENADSIAYSISVVPDLHPRITATQIKDSTNNTLIYFLGEASDDYGIRDLKFVYNIQGKSNSSGSFPVKQDGTKRQASFTYSWDLNDLDIQAGDKLNYYFEVWDNDGVMGSKSARSQAMYLELPTEAEEEEQLEEQSEQLKDDIKNNAKEAEDLQQEIKKMKEKLIQKKELDWEDKDKMKQLLEKHKELMEKMKEMQKDFEKQMEQTEEKQDMSEDTQEKKDKLKELMDELMTPELEEFLEKMEKDMEEMTNEEMMEELEDMELTDEQLQREMERMEELFKQLEKDMKTQEVIEELQELAEEEQKLAEETEKDTDGDMKEQEEKQEELNEKFEEIKEDLEDLKEMSEELGDDPEDMEENEDKAEDIEKDMEESMEQMEQQQNQKAGQKQKDAAKKMEEMAQQMQMQMGEQQQEQAEEDMQAIRQLLENLIDMSFDQEDVMDKLAETTVNNTNYTEFVQEQYKLTDDFQIIEDSIVALSKRVVQIESFVLKELTEIEKNFDNGLDLLEDRKKDQAAVNQQFVMTSVNNLALMLSEAMQQMQQQMANQMPGDGMCNKPGGKNPKGASGISKMQKQLNEQLKKMQEGQQKMPGGENPGMGNKEFAKAAKQQAEIRNALKKLNQEMNKDGKNSLGDLQEAMDEMEKTEEDLVNKRITREMIKRQQDIMTRLLEAEKAEREREKDKKRESETAQERTNEIPPEIQEYLKRRKAEIELYKTVAPELRPYYKQLVESYFKNISF